MDLLVEALELVLDLLRELDEVDVRPAAGGTGHERETALAKAERLQDVDPDLDFLGRVRGERDADRVADALREQRPEPDRRLDGPHARRPRLGHAEVERVLDLIGEHSVGLDHHDRVGRLQRDLHLGVVAVLEDPDVAERRLDHALGRGPAVLGEQVLLERAPVDTDPDRDLALLGQVHDFLHERRAADVAGVEPEAVHPLLERDQRELVVEMDVRDERDPDLALDLAEFLRRLAHRHRAADDVAAGRLERPDLEQRRLDVAGVGLRHRLHRDRRVTAHLQLAEPDLRRLSSGCHRGTPI